VSYWPLWHWVGYIIVQRAVISAFQCTGDTEAGIRRFKRRFCRAECEMRSSLTSPFISPRVCQSPRGESRAWRGLEERTWSRLNAARYRCTQSVCHVDLHCPVPFFRRQLCTVFWIQTWTWRSQVVLWESLDIKTFPFGPSRSYCSGKFRKPVLYLRCTWFKYGPSTCYIDRFVCLSLCVTACVVP